MENIRNFSIIAHIDHGKSTLSDRFIELTNTVEKRKMQDQILDSMELERERGITIKMTPVRLEYSLTNKDTKKKTDYVFNLIDTPGHIDFSYEVSRSMRAVEGAVLLVDATQGVQAQTMTVLDMAREAGLTIIPVLNKIDSPLANIRESEDEIIKLLKCEREDIKRVSGKTGEGVLELLEVIAEKVPAPKESEGIVMNNNLGISYRGMIFDFEYSNHQGVIIYTRILDGSIKKNDEVKFIASSHDFIVKEVGVFTPSKKEADKISAGEIGYIVTGIKEPGVARVGDTVTRKTNPMPAYPGYTKPTPLVFASIYPEFQEYFDDLRRALDKLRLSDSSLTYEEEQSGALGRGFRCGFLGMLHMEIIVERLKREFDLTLVVTSPSITYEVKTKDGKTEMIYTPIHFPDHGDVLSVREPWILTTIITPHDYLSNIMNLNHEYEATVFEMEDWGDSRIRVVLEMPLRELMRNYFDTIKSASSGYASVSYEPAEMRDAQVTRMDLFVAEERVAAFSRVVPEHRVDRDADEAVEKLFKILPKEWFRVKIQAYVKGRILASRSLSALSKDVTGHLYGGDITRKMKLREKQKEGKKRMQAEGKVYIGHETFLKMMK
jgi:GTP-binding protein LepA